MISISVTKLKIITALLTLLQGPINLRNAQGTLSFKELYMCTFCFSVWHVCFRLLIKADTVCISLWHRIFSILFDSQDLEPVMFQSSVRNFWQCVNTSKLSTWISLKTKRFPLFNRLKSCSESSFLANIAMVQFSCINLHIILQRGIQVYLISRTLNSRWNSCSNLVL